MRAEEEPVCVALFVVNVAYYFAFLAKLLRILKNDATTSVLLRISLRYDTL